MKHTNDSAAIVPHFKTLGDQVRGEAMRRDGEWPAMARELAQLAERWYGNRPCKGEDLALVFGEIFVTE